MKISLITTIDDSLVINKRIGYIICVVFNEETKIKILKEVNKYELSIKKQF